MTPMLPARDAVPQVLAALGADRSTEFALPGARVELLARTGGPHSIVQRVRVSTPGRTFHAYIKILKPRGPDEWRQTEADVLLEREYRATLAVYEAVRQEPLIGAVRPLAWFPEYRALVTEEVAGPSLRHILAARSLQVDQLAAVVRRVGTWIRLYQRIGGPSDVVDFARQRDYLEVRLRFLEGRILSAADGQAVLRRFETLASEAASSVNPTTWIHADLTPENVIIGDDGRITVLDFTTAKVGPAYHDLAHFYFHLQLMAARAPRRRAEFVRLGRALLDGYDPMLTAEHPLFRLLLMQHGVCHVAWIAERRVPMLDGAYRWFVRRRWHACERLLEPMRERQVA